MAKTKLVIDPKYVESPFAYVTPKTRKLVGIGGDVVSTMPPPTGERTIKEATKAQYQEFISFGLLPAAIKLEKSNEKTSEKETDVKQD